MTQVPQKIFCIGWHKTGTTTMGEALLQLGYKVVGARLDLAEPLLRNDVGSVIKEAAKFHAFQDVPWAALYQELDVAYPGSKFILTMRDEEEWLNSALKHFGDKHTDMRQWLYGAGSVKGNEALYKARFRRHNEEVLKYFKDRPDDLLVMSLKDGDGWDKLCPFLGVKEPAASFPHANKGKHNYNLKDWIKESIRFLIPAKVRRMLQRMVGVKDKRNRFNNYKENRPAQVRSRKV